MTGFRGDAGRVLRPSAVRVGPLDRLRADFSVRAVLVPTLLEAAQAAARGWGLLLLRSDDLIETRRDRRRPVGRAPTISRDSSPDSLGLPPWTGNLAFEDGELMTQSEDIGAELGLGVAADEGVDDGVGHDPRASQSWATAVRRPRCCRE